MNSEPIDLRGFVRQTESGFDCSMHQIVRDSITTSIVTEGSGSTRESAIAASLVAMAAKLSPDTERTEGVWQDA